MSEQIAASKIKLWTEHTGEKKVEVVSKEQAMQLAEETGLSLIMLGKETDEIPLVKLDDYSRYTYEQNKKHKGIKKTLTKEIKFGGHIAKNDLLTKANNAYRIMNEGHSIKVCVEYKGRDIKYIDNGHAKMKEFLSLLPSYVTTSPAKQDGNKIYMVIKL